MMKSQAWKLKKQKLYKTNLYSYSKFIKNKFKINLGLNFYKIWEWSVKNPKSFWASIWHFTNIKGNLGQVILKESSIFYKNKFFPNSKLNYA